MKIFLWLYAYVMRSKTVYMYMSWSIFHKSQQSLSFIHSSKFKEERSEKKLHLKKEGVGVYLLGVSRKECNGLGVRMKDFIRNLECRLVYIW